MVMVLVLMLVLVLMEVLMWLLRLLGPVADGEVGVRIVDSGWRVERVWRHGGRRVVRGFRERAQRRSWEGVWRWTRRGGVR